MNILHTEASLGWGGQEIRILEEALGMREKGHTVIIVTECGAKLAEKAKKNGFVVYEMSFKRRHVARSLPFLVNILRKYCIQVVNTHSSKDAWMAGVAAKCVGCKVIRTRHLSGNIRPGLNSRILYGWLADGVATTCEEVAEKIREQAGRDRDYCYSVPTGVRSDRLCIGPGAVQGFREKWGIEADEVLCGTVCILRSWKGVDDLLQAAYLLRDHEEIKWAVVGSGPQEKRLRQKCAELNLGKQVFFTGHLEDPYAAIAAFDIFLLLSTANEGVSQASLQAAYLSKPLITTATGGLKEVCRTGETGFSVASHSPHQVAHSVLTLSRGKVLRERMGQAANALVRESFTFEKTLKEMETLYQRVC